MAQAAENLLRTPLYKTHQEAGARIVPFAGWEMPLTYAGQLQEHMAVRRDLGIFDVSHMGQVRFTGAGALAFLQQLVPADVAALEDGKSRYTQLVDENGGTIDDLIVSKFRDNEYFAVVNAGTRIGDLDWMRTIAAGGAYDVKIQDESFQWAMIAVQGPRAMDVLAELIPLSVDIRGTEAFTMHHFVADGASHTLSRTGYTGETGGEILCPAELAETWWKRLVAAGAVPCGLASRDSLRLEAGYCLYGNDLSRDVSPVEAGLGWSIGWNKAEAYPGRDFLEQQKKHGPPRRLVGLRGTGRRPMRAGERVVHGGQDVGVVTSGGYSPVLETGIALALVATDVSKHTQLHVANRSGESEVSVVRPPFVSTSLSKKGK